MPLLDWLQLVYAICASGEPPANWREIAFFSNIATALAYFWIPAVMAVVFAWWREELPYRWLWIGFVLFISACGLSHVVHAFHLLRAQTPHSWQELLVLSGTALVSLVTAAGFTYLLPKILRLTSPSVARRKMQAAVDAATDELHHALEHQRILIREVHHRVKNNLQVVASLINIQQRNAPLAFADSLQDLSGRISAISKLHSQLQDVGNTTLRSLPFVNALAHSLGASSRGPEVSVEVRGDDFEVHLDHATSFALIIHEVLANAVKHAFPGRQTGRILVQLSSVGTRRSVTVLDDGVGIAANTANGTGHSLVRSLAVQLGARLMWKPRDEGGTQFVMEYEDIAALPRVPSPATETPPGSDLNAVGDGYIAGTR